jgi:hypothetical protein
MNRSPGLCTRPTVLDEVEGPASYTGDGRRRLRSFAGRWVQTTRRSLFGAPAGCVNLPMYGAVVVARDVGWRRSSCPVLVNGVTTEIRPGRRKAM